MNRDVLSGVLVSYLPRLLAFATGALAFVVITKQLSTADLGALQIIRSLCMFGVFVFTLGLQRYLAYAVPGASERRQYRVFVTVLLGEVGLYAACIVLILLPMSGWLKSKLGDFPFPSTWLWVIPAVWVIYILQHRLLLFHGFRKRVTLRALLTSGEQVIYGVGLIVMLFVGATVLRVLVFQLLAYLVILAIAIRFLDRRVLAATRPDRGILRDALLYSVPLILVDAGSRIIASSDRFMIAHFLSTSDVGLYGYVYRYFELAYLIGSPLLWAVYPHFAEAYRQGKPEREDLFHFQLSTTLAFCGFAAVGLLFHRDLLVPLLSREEFLEAGLTYPILVLYPILLVSMSTFQQVLLLERRTRLIGGLFAFATAVNIGLNLALIPTVGQAGAAIATVATYAVLTVVMLWCSRKYVAARHYRWLVRYVIAMVIWAGVLAGLGVWGRRYPVVYLVVSIALAPVLIHRLRLLDLLALWKMLRKTQ